MRKRSVAILGLGRFGISIANTLAGMGHDVLAIDRDESQINSLSSDVTHAVIGDIADEKLLASLGIKSFDVAIVAIAYDIHSSVMTTLILKEMGLKYIISRAQNDLHSKMLYKLGADQVLLPEKDMGIKLAKNLLAKNVLESLELSSDYSIVEILPPENWIGKTLKELNVRVKYGVTIMVAKHDNLIKVSPGGNHTIKSDEFLVIIGSNSDIKKLVRS